MPKADRSLYTLGRIDLIKRVEKLERLLNEAVTWDVCLDDDGIVPEWRKEAEEYLDL